MWHRENRAAYGIGSRGGHVTPNGLLQGYRAVTLRERLLNQQATASRCEKWGVYMFTRVNVLKTSD